MSNSEERGSRLYLFAPADFYGTGENKISFVPYGEQAPTYTKDNWIFICLIPIGYSLVSTEEGVFVSNVYGCLYTARQIYSFCCNKNRYPGFSLLERAKYDPTQTRATAEKI